MEGNGGSRKGTQILKWKRIFNHEPREIREKEQEEQQWNGRMAGCVVGRLGNLEKVKYVIVRDRPIPNK